MLGFDPDEHFFVPDGVYEHMSLREKGRALEEEWQARFDAWREAYPGLAERLGPGLERGARDGCLRRRAADASPTDKKLATRAAGERDDAGASAGSRRR